jgi:hypothetical protein
MTRNYLLHERPSFLAWKRDVRVKPPSRFIEASDKSENLKVFKAGLYEQILIRRLT